MYTWDLIAIGVNAWKGHTITTQNESVDQVTWTIFSFNDKDNKAAEGSLDNHLEKSKGKTPKEQKKSRYRYILI